MSWMRMVVWKQKVRIAAIIMGVACIYWVHTNAVLRDKDLASRLKSAESVVERQLRNDERETTLKARLAEAEAEAKAEKNPGLHELEHDYMDIDSVLKIATHLMETADSISEGRDVWDRRSCIKWVTDNPSLCESGNYQANCAQSCRTVAGEKTDALPDNLCTEIVGDTRARARPTVPVPVPVPVPMPVPVPVPLPLCIYAPSQP